MNRSSTGFAFFLLFGFLVATGSVWLGLGLLPSVAAASSGLHELLHEAGGGTSAVAQVARNAAATSHSVSSVSQVVMDYLFSLLNIGIGVLLIKLRPHDRAARLLALGVVGTAVAFNLQGHDALQVLPVAALGLVDIWHVLVHLLAGLSYLFALLLFPDGRLRPDRGIMKLLRVPLVIVLTWFFVGFSFATVDDHTFGLVVVFGLAVPLAGVTAQAARYRYAADEGARQQSRVLLWALVAAFGVALPLITLGTRSNEVRPHETVDYEVKIADPGTYFFRCDPHPEKMVGEVVVLPQDRAPRRDGLTRIGASNSRFDKSRIILTAGLRTTIRFANFDADLHNVAIYQNEEAVDPLFVGAEFSGHNTAAFAFRVFRVVFALIPIALFIALVRFRLWDVERVINRTLLYGVLAGFITLAYLAIVVGIGTAVGAGRRLNLLLSIVVTVVIAVTFQPLRERARKLANRIVYGKRATPYEVLTDLAQRVGDVYDVEQLIPRLAERLARGTGARRTEVWLRVGRQLTLSAAWPETEAGPGRAIQLSDGELPDFPEVDRVIAVRHRGELLGAFTVVKPPGESITPVEEQLLKDVASQAGLALKNVQLTAELQTRLDELRASRQRLVAAQDLERRRLERNIHDGAQQHLVGLSLKLGMLHELNERDPEKARALLAELQGDTGEALQALRDLARGIYPPVLADRGLVEALEAHARRCPVEVRVEANDVGRLDREVENAVYFCSLEAVQNAMKHGRPPITIRLRRDDRLMIFSVVDAGPGFDPASAGGGAGFQNMSDRLAAHGGTLELTSAPGAPTTVTGRVPLPD